MNRKRYELRLARRDGRKIRGHHPSPVIEEFDLERELDATVGKHFIPMVAAAEGESGRVKPHSCVRDFDHVLPQYEMHVHRTDGHWPDPEVVSTSTKGWRD